MDLFKNRIQPTIVHLGEYENITLSNKYFLNYNVVQIDWFANNAIVMEDGSGILVLESADDNNPLSSLSHDLMDLFSDGVYNNVTPLDIPRIYFVINDKFLSNTGECETPNVINSFITTLISLSDNCVEHNLPDVTSYITEFITKGETFNNVSLIPGEDYFINETFAKYLKYIDLRVEYPDLVEPESNIGILINKIDNITLPNYLDAESNIQEPWLQLTKTEENNSDLSIYLTSNEIGQLENQYDITIFYSVFCQVILEKSTININATDLNNLKYKKVLEYFANNKSDEASTLINLILGSKYTSETVNTGSSLCKCSTNNSASGLSSSSSLYSTAMEEHLKEMLGNIQFYIDWFFEYGDNSCAVNADLVKYLKLLIKALVDKGYDLSFNNAYSIPCKCPNGNSQSLASKTNYDIISKYDNVLNYILSCSLQYNINKTKLYGSQFGGLLPKLQF